MESTCSICSNQANEHHFGSNSPICRACSAFFRRYVLSPKVSISCPKNNGCETNSKTSKICRFCRMKKCLENGMRITAVQSPRDRYSSPKEELNDEQNENSLNLHSDHIPILLQMLKSYKNLENTRKKSFEFLKNPKNCNLFETLEIYRKDIKFVSIFVRNSFPDFAIVGKLESKQFLVHYFIKNILFETPFLGLKAGKRDLLLPDGNYLEPNIFQFYTGHLKDSNINKTHIDQIFAPYWDEYKRTLVEDMWILKIDIFEFFTISALTFWDSGLDGLSHETFELCQQMKRRIISEIQYYYKNIRKIEEPYIRLSNILLLLTALQRSFGKCQEELQMCGFYDLLNAIDNDVYRIIDDAIQI